MFKIASLKTSTRSAQYESGKWVATENKLRRKWQNVTRMFDNLKQFKSSKQNSIHFPCLHGLDIPTIFQCTIRVVEQNFIRDTLPDGADLTEDKRLLI